MPLTRKEQRYISTFFLGMLALLIFTSNPASVIGTFIFITLIIYAYSTLQDPDKQEKKIEPYSEKVTSLSAEDLVSGSLDESITSRYKGVNKWVEEWEKEKSSGEKE